MNEKDVTSELGPRTSDTVHVTVEAVAWVTRFVGGDGTRRRVFQERLPLGSTVRGALQAVCTRFPSLAEALWAPGDRELAEHIEVLVNDAVLGVRHALDSPLDEGDRITLIGAFTGG